MDSFYTREELERIGFKELGDNVKLSRKASVYSPEKIIIGSNVRIDDFCILSGQISIGNYIHIAAYTAIYGGDVGVTVGDFVNLSSRICIYSVSDDYSGAFMAGPMVPDEFRNVHEEPVIIGKHVIIGSAAMVMPGVVIAEGGAFGAFSFINKSTDAWTLYAGIPCRKIRDRSKEALSFEEKLRNGDESRK